MNELKAQADMRLKMGQGKCPDCGFPLGSSLSELEHHKKVCTGKSIIKQLREGFEKKYAEKIEELKRWQPYRNHVEIKQEIYRLHIKDMYKEYLESLPDRIMKVINNRINELKAYVREGGMTDKIQGKIDELNVIKSEIKKKLRIE